MDENRGIIWAFWSLGSSFKDDDIMISFEFQVLTLCVCLGHYIYMSRHICAWHLSTLTHLYFYYFPFPNLTYFFILYLLPQLQWVPETAEGTKQTNILESKVWQNTLFIFYVFASQVLFILCWKHLQTSSAYSFKTHKSYDTTRGIKVCYLFLLNKILNN